MSSGILFTFKKKTFIYCCYPITLVQIRVCCIGLLWESERYPPLLLYSHTKSRAHNQTRVFHFIITHKRIKELKKINVTIPFLGFFTAYLENQRTKKNQCYTSIFRVFLQLT